MWPRSYWSITGTFRAAEGPFDAQLTRWQGQEPTLTTPDEAAAVVAALRDTAFGLQHVTPKKRARKPPPPFTTSTLQQAASSHLKLAPDATMRLAQTLYEAGLITYLRTDSPAVAPEGVTMAHATITAAYGPDYVGQHTYGATGNAQQGHECIRPTDTATTPDGARLALGTDKQQAADLYALIYDRFLASQMARAVYLQVTASVVGGEAVLTARGSRRVFDGFERVYDWREESEAHEADTPQRELPPLTAGASVRAETFTPKQHWTRPPARYSEATLVRALERHGVGRPSTYAATLTTLTKRGYVHLKRRQLMPTSLGESVVGVLTSRLPALFAVDFTAGMEAALDEIAAGTRSGRAYLSAVWTTAAPQFGDSIVQATLNAGRTPKKRPAPDIDPALGSCPTCGHPLVTRHGKYGDFIGCSAFPHCRYTRKHT